MVEWAAANISEQSGQKQDDNLSNDNTGGSNKRRRTSETPEAALVRLTTSYSTAMTAIGALHKASTSIAKKLKKKTASDRSEGASSGCQVEPDEDTNEYDGDVEDGAMDIDDESKRDPFDSIKRVSTAARDAFENALLSDPLIMKFCPTFANVFLSNFRAEISEEVSLSSAAHQNTLKELTYAGLINYADLLTSTCACARRDHEREVKGRNILDRGIVPLLKAIDCKETSKTMSQCVWHGIEQEDRTMRLALVAYCDACSLDGSDPTSWLKLACAARTMGKVLRNSEMKQQDKKAIDKVDAYTQGNSADQTNESNEGDDCTQGGDVDQLEKYINLDFERLERLAVERGLTALQSNVPPNRAILRAFRELEKRQMGRNDRPYRSVVSRLGNDSAELIIDLPRYSWSTLGRNLLRVCREGVTSNHRDGWNIEKSWKSSAYTRNDITIPRIRVKICPLFVLPKNTLRQVCEFLGDESKKLEATCRSLSVDIISARAFVEKESNMKMKQMEQEMGDMLKEIESDAPIDESNQEPSKQELLKLAHRTSKRVRSQLMTSGKQAERGAKRKSVEYCFASSILPCTIDHPDYRKCVNKKIDWDSLRPLYTYSNLIKEMSKLTEKNDKSKNTGENALVEKDCKQRVLQSMSKERASMVAFMKRWSTTNSGARDMLQRFLAHISCHVSAVYESENGNIMVLTQCIKECFDLLKSCNSTYGSLSPSWFGDEVLHSSHTNNSLVAIETLAINLFCAELQMRSCERHGLKIVSFDDDVQAVRTNIPKLIYYAETLDKDFLQLPLKSLVSELKVRTYWLVSHFYVWCSRNTSNLHEVKQLESLALEFLGKAITTFVSNSIKTVATPHLFTLGRIRWVELSYVSLLNYRDHLESSTVISRVRQKFFDCISDLKSTEDLCVARLPDPIKTQLASIEGDLIERYQIRSHGPEQNVDELISDFIIRYKEGLANKIVQDPSIVDTPPQGRWRSLWGTIPSSQDSCIRIESLKNPALLTILFACLQRKEEYASNVGKVLVQLLIAILDKRSQVLKTRVALTDNFVLSDDSDSSEDGSESNTDDGSSDPLVLKRLAHFVMQKLQDIMSACHSPEFYRNNLHVPIMCATKIAFEHSLGMLPDYNNRTLIENLFLRLQPNQEMLEVIISISAATIKKLGDASDHYHGVLSAIFTLLVKSIIHSKKMILFIMSSREKNNLSRSECHPLIMLHSKFVAACATELASLLTRYSNQYIDGQVDESFLIKSLLQLQHGDYDGQSEKDLSSVVQLAESLSWFWDFVYSAESIDNPNVGPRYSSLTNTVHKQASKPLLVPIAACVAALLGSVGHGPSSDIAKCFSALPPNRQMNDEDPFCPSDFFESDESAKKYVGDNQSKRRLLQALSRTVQCIGLVFSHYRDKDLATVPSCVIFPLKKGFFLPLIVARALSQIADFVLVEFGETEERPRDVAVWEQEYPFGFRCAGAQLDLLLLRAYRCLHGVTLTSSHLMSQLAKDAVVPPLHPGSSDNSMCYFKPESTEAAIRMYRCVMRSAFNSRKRVPVPIEVFDCIRSALPKEIEDEGVHAIKGFIYGKRDDLTFCAAKEDMGNITNGEDIDTVPPGLPFWLINKCSTVHQKIEQCEGESHIQIVKKGIWQYLADSPLPIIGSNSESSAVQYSGSDRTALERKIAARTELAVEKQLCAIINAVRYDALNENKWFRAGLCISVKLNLVLDRLIPAERGYTFGKFSPLSNIKEERKACNHERYRRRNASKLLKDQRRVFFKSTSRAIHKKSDSHDLSIYMQHQFCCAKSLEALTHSLQRSTTENNTEGERKRLLSVQETGSCFISALRLIRYRCYRMAMYLSKRKEGADRGESIYSHVAETFGTAEFDAISYSAHRQTMFERRRTAVMASKLFQASVYSLRSSINDDSENCPATWESLFMVGKCCEKIANTLKEEGFVDDGKRLYEQFMHQSLFSYHTALVEAKIFEDGGNSLEFQGGGSSHGLVELKYRVHATRLKVLIAAIKDITEDIDRNIAEALRISEKYWFKTRTIDYDRPLKDRLWSVLVDIVEGLASCRNESSHFHRSVYRHAQALLWAPVLYDPQGATNTNMKSIPEDKGRLLHGLQNGSWVESAELIISGLFDKKRSQLVAVWVTTPTSPTPFETINESARKFDRLRCKYIAAYIETMYLCKRQEKLETFIKWTHAAPRDLPSFYSLRSEVNALGGNRYQESHCKDNLLLPSVGLVTFTKIMANAALCRILLGAIGESPSLKQEAKDNFGDIYTCFLRLNCPLENPIWQTQQTRKLLNASACFEVDSLITAYQSIYVKKSMISEVTQMSWEEKMLMLRTAVSEGQKLSASKDDLETNKKARKKRKMLDNTQNPKADV